MRTLLARFATPVGMLLCADAAGAELDWGFSLMTSLKAKRLVSTYKQCQCSHIEACLESQTHLLSNPHLPVFLPLPRFSDASFRIALLPMRLYSLLSSPSSLRYPLSNASSP